MSNKYRVIVDGTAYTVEVENLGAGAAMPAPVAASAAPVAAAPAPAAAPAAEAPAAPAAVAEGASTVTAPMPGKILNVKVNVGDSVNNGDLVLLLEAMKMETEIKTEKAGRVSKILVNVKDVVTADQAIATIEE